ncbi:hypothetical protein ACM40_06785 [Chryseobacterium sp. BLS98]|jgi:hypothetical protein|uniref:hypothetical protein n=1 Tax=Chryseobacterium sp. BLS98 TaxID=885586 RepID=UPI00065AAEF1|nr:hypothetical protein [Chryseobacterium sp. BLS98]KMQ62016.1 hypothetical protein ACM40_06785 [Chryseobacterium sp. BLS98]
MKITNKLILFITLLFNVLVFGQVGINTSSPKATMDVNAKRANLDGTGAIDNAQTLGLLAPRLTRAELTGNTATYGANQAGALIYVTDVSGGDTLATRANVTAIGYYYFDSGANLWKAIGSGGGALTATYGLTNPTPTSIGIVDPIRFIYTPSISISTTLIQNGQTLNIYNEYVKQFSGTGNSPLVKNATTENATIPVYDARYFDFYITAYDTSVFANVSITDNGLLTYDVTGTASACSFMNIVMVLRKLPRP